MQRDRVGEAITMLTVPTRAEMPREMTWDVASVFPDDLAWDAAAADLEQRLAELAAYRGRLAESGATLLAWVNLTESLMVDLGRLVTYALMLFDTDTANPAHGARWGQAQGLLARASAAGAFEVPELAAAGRARIDALMAETPALGRYAHRFDALLRRADHTRSSEVEEVLALAGEPLWSFLTTRGALVDADLRFGTIAVPGGDEAEVAEGTIGGLLEHGDRSVRRAAWERHADGFLAHKNTLAALLAGHIKATVFRARVRHYGTSRAMVLDNDHIPGAVFEHVVAAFRDHVGTWHRYWDLRRRALAVEALAPYDVWAPLSDQVPQVGYAEACRWILDGMGPLGPEYLVPLERGLNAQRWVDVLPNRGKRGGAYSGGSYGTHPFVLLNWTGGVNDLSILAHELGHSMHSYLSWHHQPPSYGEYSVFAAEVASNFNQALVRAHLLEVQPDPHFQVAVLSEALTNFHRYFFTMPVLAQWEDAMYRRAEAGEGLTAEAMSAAVADLFGFGYGPGVDLDMERVGIAWAQFPHMYMNYYVFQYATGIAAATVLAEDVRAGVPGAAQRYLGFLKAGGSQYPLDALRQAGVDMADRAPLDRAFAVLARYVDRLDGLLADLGH
jgi:oligoendopeptidase F